VWTSTNFGSEAFAAWVLFAFFSLATARMQAVADRVSSICPPPHALAVVLVLARGVSAIDGT